MTQVTRLPFVGGNYAIAGQAADPAQLFATAWMALLGDRARDKMWDERLAHAAYRQAEFLAHNDFVPGDPHRGHLGSTANQRVRATGYKLPAWMGDGNVVESVIRSWDAPEQAAHDLAHHDTHREHMAFSNWWERWGFAYFGVGYAPAKIDRGGAFYVCCTGPMEE